MKNLKNNQPGMTKIESCRGKWTKRHEAEWFTKTFVTQPKWGTLHKPSQVEVA